MAITDAWLKANNGKGRDKVGERSDREGLSARISAKGKITFQMRFRYEGKPCRLDIGSYPQTTLKKARTESSRLKGLLSEGHDPRIVKHLEKRNIVEALSFESLFRQWYEKYCVKNKKAHHEILRTFEIYVFNKIGELPVQKISIHQYLDLMESLTSSKPSIAERILINTKQCLNWAVRRQLVELNPLLNINAKADLQITSQAATRSLDNEEIKMVFSALANSRMTKKNKLFVKLCLIYGCRNGELRLSEKKHFDFKKRVWTIPPENHKLGKTSKKPLLRPITEETELLLNEAFLLSKGSKYVFTNANNNEVMSRSAPLALPYNLMQWLRRHKTYEMVHWSMHDLRKTARTNFSTLTQPHIAEIILGHKLPGEWQTYDQHDYLNEQAEAISAWCKRLDELTAD